MAALLPVASSTTSPHMVHVSGQQTQQPMCIALHAVEHSHDRPGRFRSLPLAFQGLRGVLQPARRFKV